MNWQVIIRASAQREFGKAADWYEMQSKGLGTRFINVVNDQVQKIAHNPEHYSFRQGLYRGVKIPDFPYTIIYQVFP